MGFFVVAGRVDGEQAFWEGHFYALLFEVDFTQVCFDEGNKQFLVIGGGFDHEQRGAGGFFVDAGDGSDICGVAGSNVDDVASDQVIDVDGVVFEWGALVAGDGQVMSAQRLGAGDGVDPDKLEDDAALVQPVVFKFDGARRCSVRREQEEMTALGEALGEIGEDVGDELAVAALRANEMRDKHQWLWIGHESDCMRMAGGVI